MNIKKYCSILFKIYYNVNFVLIRAHVFNNLQHMLVVGSMLDGRILCRTRTGKDCKNNIINFQYIHFTRNRAQILIIMKFDLQKSRYTMTKYVNIYDGVLDTNTYIYLEKILTNISVEAVNHNES